VLRIRLTDTQREELERLKSQPGRVGPRVQMVLLSDEGKRVREIAQLQHCSKEMVRTWLHRYEVWGVHGLENLPHGRPQSS
jgi:transposase